MGDYMKENLILPKHPSTRKDKWLGLLLILLFLSDYVWASIIPTEYLIPVIIVYYISIIVFSIFIYKDDLKRDFEAFKNNKGEYIKYAFKRWGFMILTVMIAGIILVLLGVENESVNQQLIEKLPFFIIIPLAIIEAPLVEETIFRGVIRKYINNDTLFIIVSGIAFGAIHVLSEASLVEAITAGLTYAVMGVNMAYAYAKTNNMFVNIMMHCIQNTMAVIMLFF